MGSMGERERKTKFASYYYHCVVVIVQIDLNYPDNLCRISALITIILINCRYQFVDFTHNSPFILIHIGNPLISALKDHKFYTQKCEKIHFKINKG